MQLHLKLRLRFLPTQSQVLNGPAYLPSKQGFHRSHSRWKQGKAIEVLESKLKQLQIYDHFRPSTSLSQKKWKEKKSKVEGNRLGAFKFRVDLQ